MTKEEAETMRSKVAEYDRSQYIVRELTKMMMVFHNNGESGLVSQMDIQFYFLSHLLKMVSCGVELSISYEHVPDIGKKINEFMANLFCEYQQVALKRLEELK